MRVIYLIFLILMVSCGGDDFKKIEKLGEFRILAVLADTPEVAAPGASANLRLFVSDVKAAGRVITGTTVACIDPGIALGAKVSCDHDPSALTSTYTVDTTSMASALYTGAMPNKNFTVPNNIFTGRSPRAQFNGIAYIVIFNFTVDGESISAFKRITVTNRGGLNNNPTGSAILLNGGAIAAFPKENDELKVTTSTSETFNYQTIDGNIESRTEKMKVAWYLNEGELAGPKTDVGEGSKYLGPNISKPSLLIAVVRDERGGVDIVIKSFP